MENKNVGFVFAAVCAVIILFGLSCASWAVDVPAKLKDIPIFQGAKIEQAMDMENHAMLTAKVNAKPEAIASFYKGAMEAKGWKTFFQAEQENTRIIQFQKGDQMLQIGIQTDGDGTTFNLVVTTK